MNLDPLIAGLSRPEVYGSSSVTVHQTHISVVFVTDDRAFKLKKPVDFGFVDYSTPDRRRAMCDAEVRLNRRLAEDVYLGVRAVVARDGGFMIGDADDPDAVDWVVEMTRLEDEDNFLARLHAGTLGADSFAALGRLLAAFHARCARAEPGRYGAFETVAKNARENFSQSTEQVGHTVAAHVFEAARSATERQLQRLQSQIQGRDQAGLTCDSHGDLRLEHIYDLGGELVVVDCIEFNDAFRFADPVADIAFLVMDLQIRWAADLAGAFTHAYGATSEVSELLDFYVAYRSAVRAKVHGLAAVEPELDHASRQRALTKSRAHWLFAWSTLAPPEQRPALVMVAGLPGTGKSTLGRMLRDDAGFQVNLDSDHVRKELAGVDPETSMRDELDAGIYTSEWTKRTYAECLRRALAVIHDGGRVVVSATFRQECHRQDFLRAAHAAGVAGYMLECQLDPDEVVRRIEARHGDASDADVATYDHVATLWESAGEFVASRTRAVRTSTIEQARQDVMGALRAWGLRSQR